MAKYIFITGGVVSGLGKGITGSSLGVLLKNSGLKIFMQKFDPYLNVDPGTMSPIQHGEVYVTSDGAETDLDLGHYERFIDVNLSKNSSVSSGKIYKDILDAERRGDFKGQTVQVIPHVTNAIKNKVYIAAEESKADIIITEIGGTIGDIESQPFIEAIREIRMEKGRNSVIFIHVALLPWLAVSNEHKTKPIQHSVKELLQSGVQPDVIVARTSSEISESIKAKLAMFCNIDLENVIVTPDMPSIYAVPLNLAQQNLHKIVAKQFEIELKNTDLSAWIKFNEKINSSVKEVQISLVGKYVELHDAYLSVTESLKFSGYENNVKVKINWVNSQDLNEQNYEEILQNSQGILVPGGFGERGISGKVLAIKYARENKIPFLGICLGMQLVCIEFATNVLKLEDANSTEFKKDAKNPIIYIIEGKNLNNIGGTLRLGEYETDIKSDTLASKLYGSEKVFERHRHRFEFNNKYREIFKKNGIIFSGIYKERDLVEIVELQDHPFFIACQYHPEFTSRPNKPNPLFLGLVTSAIKHQIK